MGDIATQIRHAVEALSTNSQNQGRRLRELLDESPAVFRQVVAAMLAAARDTPEIRYVIALLSARGMLVPMLRDLSSTDRGAAGVVAQLAQRMDPRFDRSILRSAHETPPPVDRNRPDAEFLLGLLDELSGVFCLLPMLAPLRHSDDPNIRARMALMLGRITQAQDWFRDLEQDTDPRVRANLVESLWQISGEGSIACFRRNLSDAHHRVVANALVGLYLHGETSGVSGMVRLAQHDDSSFRAAAAWAMGRTGDARFLPLLRQSRRGPDQDSAVVRNALHAIARINQATVAAARRETRVICLRQGCEAGSTLDVIAVSLDTEPAPLPELRPTDWQIRANCRPIWAYQADLVQPTAPLTMGLVLPKSPADDASRALQFNEALRALAMWRRPMDQFAASLYSESATSHFQAANPIFGDISKKTPMAGLQSDPAAVLTSAHQSSHPIDALNHLAALLKPAGGEVHLVLVLDAIPESHCGLDALPKLLATLQERSVRLHCLITSRAAHALGSAFQKLSFETGGFSLRCAEMDEMSSTLQALIASTLAHYHLRCELPEIVEQVEIELQAEAHQGRFTISGTQISQSSRVAA